MEEISKHRTAEGEFLRLYIPQQHRIMGYLLTLVGDREVAADLLQETAVTLWEKFASFEKGTDFLAWALQIAYWKVKNYRRSLARSKILFSDQILEQIADRVMVLQPELGARRAALDHCLKRLDERDRAFLLARYEPGGDVPQAARNAGRSIQAAYKALQRLRRALRDCVSLQIATNS